MKLKIKRLDRPRGSKRTRKLLAGVMREIRARNRKERENIGVVHRGNEQRQLRHYHVQRDLGETPFVKRIREQRK